MNLSTETVAQLCSMDSALPTDHARYTMRQFQKFGVPVTAALKEVANLEADNSLYVTSMEPMNSTRASCLPDPSGYAILGSQVDINFSMDDETAAALMDSPADHGARIDLESSGSDHQTKIDFTSNYNYDGKPFAYFAVIKVKTCGKKQYPLIFGPLSF